MRIGFLRRLFCGLTLDKLTKIVGLLLSLPQLESLGESLLNFHDISDLENWLSENC
jgi:hypothetical protein